MALSRNSSTESLLLLVAQLHIQDTEDLKESQKGKGRFDAPVADSEFAIELYRELLEADMLAVQDRRLAMSMGRACDLDGAALETFMQEEARAQRDRDCAVRLSRPGSVRSSAGPNSGAQSPNRPTPPSPLLAAGDLSSTNMPSN